MFERLNPFAASASLDASEIIDLRVYPIKSCRGFSLRKSYLTRQGLDLDRRWMFVDAKTHKFMTIREISEMTLIDTALASTSDTESSNPSPLSPHGGTDAEQLVISIKNTDKKVMIPARPTQAWLDANTSLAQVHIWGIETDGYAYSDNINSIFTEFLGKPVKLVYKGPTPRILKGFGSPAVLGREESTNFPDVMPLTVANEASLRELNTRLKAKGSKEIEVERFRPNVIVRGASSSDESTSTTGENDKAPKAWSEDSWKTIRFINHHQPGASRQKNTGLLASLMGGGSSAEKSLDVDVAARCARCQVPNVDPDTAEKDKHEPWDTLVSYRRIDEGIKWKPCFAMLCAPRTEGLLEVGTGFEVLETTEEHNYKKGS